MKTKTWKAIILLILPVMAMLPLPALAAICFQMTPISGTTPYTDVIVLEVDGGPAGIYHNLLGEVVNACGDGTSMPLNGVAHLRDDGKAHFAITVHSFIVENSAVPCLSYSVQGTLDPTSFNSGAGFLSTNSGVNAITISAVDCPDIPQ